MLRLPNWRCLLILTCLNGAYGLTSYAIAAEAASGTMHVPEAPSAEQIIARVVQRSEKQDYQLQGYSVTRQYTLRNRHLDGVAGMTVLLKYEAGHGKQFSVLQSAGPGVAQHALFSLLKEEKSNEENPSWNAVSESNYRFTLLGQETHDRRQCYHLRITPRQNGKLLIDGELWVDMQDLAVVGIKGRPARSLSFWFGRPLIEQHFAPVNGFWMPSGNQTTAQVRLAGETELNIEYRDYKFSLPSLSLRRH